MAAVGFSVMGACVHDTCLNIIYTNGATPSSGSCHQKEGRSSTTFEVSMLFILTRQSIDYEINILMYFLICK
jgi:hypothetical protein